MFSYTLALGLYFSVVLSLGFFAFRRTNNIKDYVIAGRSLGVSMTALGACAADMSGWLMFAMPGAVFTKGLSQIWMPLSLCIGAFLNWHYVAKKLRIATEKYGDALTIPSYLQNRFNDSTGLIKKVTGLVILIFFTFYAASGFVSVGILLESAFDLSYFQSLSLGVLVITLYTITGGFLAINWIDLFQGGTILLALIIVPWMTYTGMTFDLATLTPGHIDLFSNTTVISFLSLMAWGLGYFGQPHILSRFMAVKNPNHIHKAKRIAMSWMIVALSGAILTGYFGAHFFKGTLQNPEVVFLELSKTLFPSWLAGLLLAAALSAVMSTVSALLISCSSALTEDLFPHIQTKLKPHHRIHFGRFATIIVAITAFVLSLDPKSSILQLVAHAWAGLGASFGPVILLSLWWDKMTLKGAVMGMLTGAATVIIWPLLKDVHSIFQLYELLPGFVLSLGAAIFFSRER